MDKNIINVYKEVHFLPKPVAITLIVLSVLITLIILITCTAKTENKKSNYAKLANSSDIPIIGMSVMVFLMGIFFIADLIFPISDIYGKHDYVEYYAEVCHVQNDNLSNNECKHIKITKEEYERAITVETDKAKEAEQEKEKEAKTIFDNYIKQGE